MVSTMMDRELGLLFDRIYELGCFCMYALSDAAKAIAEGDVALAERVIAGDDVIDDLALAINTESFRLIARYQPVAFDLRALEAIIRMAFDLERVADLAASMARAVPELGTRSWRAPGLKPMVDKVVEMLGVTLVALLDRDCERAQQIFPMDDEVDDLEDEVFSQLLREATEGRDSGEPLGGMNRLLMVPRIVERAGDHVTNLAEAICHMLSGVRVRASDLRRPRPGR